MVKMENDQNAQKWGIVKTGDFSVHRGENESLKPPQILPCVISPT